MEPPILNIKDHNIHLIIPANKEKAVDKPNYNFGGKGMSLESCIRTIEQFLKLYNINIYV